MQIAARLLEIHRRPELAKTLVAKARAFVAERGQRMMQAVSASG